MAGQYSLRSFLRHVPNALLQRYLQAHAPGNEIDWEEITETQVNPIVHDIGEAPENTRAQIESDFRFIHSMATEGGVQTIIDESREFPGRVDLTEALGSMSGHHERAFWTFLEHRRIFDVAYRFNRADNLSGRSWRKRGNFPEGEPVIDEDSQQHLADTISAYYREREGRGYSCTVEHYRRGARLYWFVYPEDYADTSIEYSEEGDFERRSRRPAFEMIFVYTQDERTLDLFVKGSTRIVNDLQAIWSETILGEPPGEPENRGVTYELNGLKRRNFPFPTEPEDEITEVKIRKMRLSIRGSGNRRIVLEADVRQDRQAIHALLRSVTRSQDLPLGILNVTQVGFQIIFRSTNRRGEEVLNFDVSFPNSCSLKYDPKHEIAKRCLRRWGIDVS